MSGYRDTLREVAAMTAPSAEAVARLQRRLDAKLRSAHDLLSAVPELRNPTTASSRRLGLRLGAKRRRRSYALPLAGGALAAAAIAVFLAWPRPPEPVAAHMSSEGSGTISPAPGVTLAYSGAGSVGGDTSNLLVAWEGGDLAVEVEPGMGIQLAVETAEGRVKVVGTGFTVKRDPLGTEVRVRHGIVEVACARGSFHRLQAGDATTCLPGSAAGLLGRARALEDRDAPAADVVHTVDLGLASSPGNAVRGELLATRVQALQELGRYEEALQSAETYLEAGGPRADAVEHLAASLAWSLGGCERAAPLLARIEQPTADEAAWGCPAVAP
jgi:ferric-dicitrate binding protein FerR (iron transport regulator)